jgi:hypothetical protein
MKDLFIGERLLGQTPFITDTANDVLDPMFTSFYDNQCANVYRSFLFTETIQGVPKVPDTFVFLISSESLGAQKKSWCQV